MHPHDLWLSSWFTVPFNLTSDQLLYHSRFSLCIGVFYTQKPGVTQYVANNYSFILSSPKSGPSLSPPLLKCPGPITCATLTSSSLMNTRHTFVFRGCLTPIASGSVPQSVSVDSTITLRSPNLANCLNMVKLTVGTATSNLLSGDNLTNSTHLSFQIGETNAVAAAVPAFASIALELVHQEMGAAMAVNADDSLIRSVFLIPQISASNVVQTGSILGLGFLNVLGVGFKTDRSDYLKVTLGAKPYGCRVVNAGPGIIQCIIDSIQPNELSSTSPTEAIINVTMYNNWTQQWLPARCVSAPNCLYVFDIRQTPILTSVYPQQVSGFPVTLYVDGINMFYTTEPNSYLYIIVEGIYCWLASVLVDGQRFSCNLERPLPYGNHTVLAINLIRGAATDPNSSGVLSLPNVVSLSPQMGSFAGGQYVCLSGNGLDAANIEIVFGDAVCTIDTSATRTTDHLCCSVPMCALPLFGRSTLVDVFARIPNIFTSASLKNAYNYSLDYTPAISGATIDVIGDSNGYPISRVTISGKQLTVKTGLAVSITLGKTVTCKLYSQADTQVVCTTSELKTGNYSVNVLNNDWGLALTSTFLTVDLVFSYFSPDTSEYYIKIAIYLFGLKFISVLSLKRSYSHDKKNKWYFWKGLSPFESCRLSKIIGVRITRVQGPHNWGLWWQPFN